MNILMIASDNDKASGAFRSMTRLASLLKNSFDHNLIVVISRKGNGIELLNKEKIPYVYIRSYNWVVKKGAKRRFMDKLCFKTKKAFNIIATYRIRNVIKNNKIDIVHINTSWTYVGATAALKENTKLIWHIREFLEEDQNAEIWDKKFGYDLMNRADRIVAISNSIKDKYDKIVNANKIVVVYNGLNLEDYHVVDRCILTGGIKRLLIVGTVNENKGQKELIDALSFLVEKGYNSFRLSIAGKGNSDYIQKLKNIVEERGLSEKISFLGFVSDVAKLYSENDITCVCSAFEAFGRVTVEAMLGGNLVIGANTAATTELINDYNTGILYQQGDSKSLADRIIWCFDNIEQSQEIAKKGQTFMYNNMSDVMNAEKISKIYFDVCASSDQ